MSPLGTVHVRNDEQGRKWFYSILKSEGVEAQPYEKKFLADARISFFYGMDVLFLLQLSKTKEPTPVAFISYKINKDGYLNLYFIYTLRQYRNKGYQKEILSRLIEEVNGKFRRIFSKASTIDSAIFYWKMGFEFHSANYNTKELIVDSNWDDLKDEPWKTLQEALKHKLDIGKFNKSKMLKLLLVENFYGLPKSMLRKIKL